MFGPNIIVLLMLLIIVQAPEHEISGFVGDLINGQALLKLIAQFFALFFKLWRVLLMSN